MEYSGKTFIVTGANSGIGKYCALEIAKRGGKVHMLCRNPERGEIARVEIAEESGSDDIHLHIVDLSEPSSICKV